MVFPSRAHSLPALGLGVSTEHGASAAANSLDLNALCYREPAWASFLEVGVEVARGIDRTTRSWSASGLPTTYHFLDLNLDHPEDFDTSWLDGMRALVRELRPAWICGDAGLWHFGPRERGHMLLLPPILNGTCARLMADGISRLRDAMNLEVIPENPPGHVFLGDMRLLEFFRELIERADTGMLLDCAHLAIYQRIVGRRATDGLDDFPLDRVIELHVAGGSERLTSGFGFIEDDHGPSIHRDTWEILEYVAPRAPNLKAVVFECERNPLAAIEKPFERIGGILASSALAGRLQS